MARLAGESGGSGCPGWVRGSLPTVGTWGRTWGGCVELARAPALARGSKQATRDMWAQLRGGELGAVGPCLRGGEGMCVPTVSSDHGSAPAPSWQDQLAAPSCLQRPECLGARVLPSGSWGRATALPDPCRAAEVLQGSSPSLPGHLSGCRDCGGPTMRWLGCPAGRVVMGNVRAPWICKHCPGLGMSRDCWRVKPQAGGCPPSRASAGSCETAHL